MFTAANQGVSGYPFLTTAAANMLLAFGSEKQKDIFVKPMIEGRWFGTMCLSEPHAGSSLSDIRTKATPTSEEHYLIQGTKMWISGGDHDLSENIVEMVLAKIPGGPEGVGGISLFIVPKYRVNKDGTIGEFNNIALAGLNHKMGQRGTTNCLLNFGEKGPCHGYLVGQPHKGLHYMFHMMNEARIGVGFSAVINGLAGYLYSLEYARNRPQGRRLSEKDPTKPQVMISQHGDIKRLLMTQKAYVEGAMALQFYCSSLLEKIKLSDDIESNKDIELLLDIITPVAKSWPSEFCLEANKLAMQILGGYGYTREYPIERYYRDNRLNPIHEGTHGIQGLDLLGRKVVMKNGKALALLLAEIEKTIMEASEIEAYLDYVKDLKLAVDSMSGTIEKIKQCENPESRLANATLFLDAFGHVIIAWMWLKQAKTINAVSATLYNSNKAFYDGKRAACQFFFRYELPKVQQTFSLVASLDDTCLMAEESFFIGV
jgi:butyryl-CoA dehydrogenase